MASPVALVTGASAGIGEVFARRLAQRKRDLVLVARRKDRLDAIAEALRETYKVRVEVLPADLADSTSPRTLLDQINERDLYVDMLVNNAGFGFGGRFENMPLETLQSLLKVNIDALAMLCHVFLPGMLDRKRGTILNVASVGAFQPVPFFSVYAASKAFVVSFSEALAEEVRSRGVTVSCLCPGSTTSEFETVAKLDVEGFRWTYATAESVVDAGLAGADRGHAVTVPGAINQMQVGIAKISPRFVVAKVAGLIFQRVAGVKD